MNRPLVTIKTDSKIPTNSFIHWLDERYTNNDIIFDVNYADEGNVNDFIKDYDIKNWKSTEPVFISTQTGSGKNYFIKDKLVKDILYHNCSSTNKKSILILSNRIALHRQSKLDYADLIYSVTGDRDVYDKLKQLYTFRGFDLFYMDFGEYITICSYHQLLERKILDNRRYDYIVCDEAHFFIQDSIFNLYTDDMLRYIVDKGRDSIRIYMSATLNLAMEAILREEYKKVEIANIQYKTYVDNPMVSIAQNEYEKLVRSNTKISLRVKIYYIKRDYSFIKNIYKFKDLNELIDSVNKSKSKWLIFVKSKADGELIEKSLNQRKCIFISRERIDNDDKIESIYNDIIEKQYYDQEVLITTSVLDNGINLLPDSEHHPIRNIVLFSLDKTQFLQMLGRVRTVKDKCLNIFLYEYPKYIIKFYLDKSIEELLKRLQCDMWDREEKIENYNSKYFKIIDRDNTFCDYNDYSIIKLLDTAKRMLDLYINENKIKEYHNDNIDIETIRNRLLFNIKIHWRYIHLYSGSIYYLLESCDKELDNYLDFENFFYRRILPDFFMKEIENRSNMMIEMLPLLTQNIIEIEYRKHKDLVRKINHIIEEIKKLGIVISDYKEKKYFYLINSYINISSLVYNTNSIEEQLSWLTTITNEGYIHPTIDNIKDYEEPHKQR